MTLDLKEIIQKLKMIESRFNKSTDPQEKYALIQALNHIAEKELAIHGYWETTYHEAMIRKFGAEV